MRPLRCSSTQGEAGGEAVPTMCGDVRTVDARSAESFDLVLLLVNTLDAIPTLRSPGRRASPMQPRT